MLKRTDITDENTLIAYLHQQAEIVTTLRTLTGAVAEVQTPALFALLSNTVRDTEAAVLPFVGPR